MENVGLKKLRVPQEILSIFWYPTVQYCFRRRPPTILIVSTPSLSVSLSSVRILSYYLYLGLPRGFIFKLHYRKHVCFSAYRIRSTCTGHIILLGLVTFTISDVAYQPWSSSLGRFFQLLPLGCIEGLGGWGGVRRKQSVEDLDVERIIILIWVFTP